MLDTKPKEMPKTIKINEDALCVLKLDSNSNLVMVDYEMLPRTLDYGFQILLSKYESKSENTESILNFIKNNNYGLNILLEHYDYCEHLGQAWQGIAPINKRFNKNYFIESLNQRLLAFYLNETYIKCSKDNTILAYSHRKVGWSTPIYNLNKDFSIEVKTNFGFGSASYFYVLIKFKQINIIPYSDLIKYHIARSFEMIGYSAKFILKNESWLEAMNFACDACNLSLNDEDAFVKKYIIEELEGLVQGLGIILRETQFKYLDYNRIYVDVTKEGRDLIEFRGEKLSGALIFINSIIQLEKVTKVDMFIQKIEELCKSIQPSLDDEIKLIDKELEKLNSSLMILTPEYERISKTKNYYERSRESIKQGLIKKGVFTVNNFSDQLLEPYFLRVNPFYNKFIDDSMQFTYKYDRLNDEINSLGFTNFKIAQYSNAISNYFANK